MIDSHDTWSESNPNLDSSLHMIVQAHPLRRALTTGAADFDGGLLLNIDTVIGAAGAWDARWVGMALFPVVPFLRVCD